MISLHCKTARSLGCTCQIKVNKFGQKIKSGKHQAACFYKQGVEVPSDFASKLDIETVGQNIKHEMHAQVTKLSEDNHVAPDKTWNQVNTKFIAKARDNYQGMTSEELRKLVNNTRQARNGEGKIQKVEPEFCGTTKGAFLHHSSLFADKKGIQQMMCFALKELYFHICQKVVSYCYTACCSVVYCIQQCNPPTRNGTSKACFVCICYIQKV